MLVVTHTPGRHALGKQIHVHQRGFAIGGADADIEVAGAEQSGSSLKIEWKGFEVVNPRPEWVASATGRIRINGALVGSVALRTGDRLRVVETFFQFLCGHDLERQFHETIYHLTIQDFPTGLHNARSLTEELERDLRHFDKYGKRLCLAVLEFEPARAEHASSHDALGQAAKTLSNQLGGKPLLARSDEWELVVMMRQAEAHEVEARLERWVRAHGLGEGVRVRFGAAESTPGIEAQALIHRARAQARPLSG